MKTEKEKKFTSKEDAKQTMKKIGMVLSVVTFVKLAFWVAVNTAASNTLLSFMIQNEIICLTLSGSFAFCASALIYMVYRAAMVRNIDPRSEGFKKMKAICWCFDMIGICVGLLVAATCVPDSPIAMLLAAALGMMPFFSHREAVSMACERLIYERFAKYTIDKAPDE